MGLAIVLTTSLLAASSVAAMPASPGESGFDNDAILDRREESRSVTFISIEELQAIDELEEAKRLTSRDSAPWVDDNFFRFYLAHHTSRWCGGGPTNCGNNHDARIYRRDACDWDRCDGGRDVSGVFDVGGGLCNKRFTACRLKNARWNLIMRQTGDAGSCQNMASVWLGSGPAKRTYARLHDDANGRQVGWCWYERSHKFYEFCGIPYNVDSLIKCRWMPV